MSVKLTVTRRGALRGDALPRLRAAAEELGTILAREMREALQERPNHPYKTGNLQSGWQVEAGVWNGADVIFKIVNPVVYAHYQNTKTRNAGYIERGLAKGKERVADRLRDTSNLLADLWDGGNTRRA